jgi:superfamily II DNA or RNA helicase
MDYDKFIEQKTQLGAEHGFAPVWMPDMLFDFQKALVEWSVRKGRAAIFADCGLGKTFMQLTWAENVARKTNGKVLILTPLAVAFQTVKEGEKIGVEVTHRREGIERNDRIVVTNYERLHHFNPADFDGVVCDESSILKHFSGVRQKDTTRFMAKIPYRLLCTATAAPNDYVELGTSSMALGELSHSEMLKRYFKQLDDKGQKSDMKKQKEAETIGESAPQYYQKLAYRVAQSIGQWRLKNHAVDDFWRWVASWARACRMPSDLGFSDKGFVLPQLVERDHIIKTDKLPDGMLFSMPAFGLSEEREERKRTISERCEFIKDLVNHNRPAVVWCHTNDEGDMLEKIIPDALQIAGKTPDDTKERIYDDFVNGALRVLVIKPKIGAWGLNWQHCNHVVTFASHSYEQYYQSVRRCWRFGQKKEVTLDCVATEGELRVLANMRRKSEQAGIMFEKLVEHMNNATKIERENKMTKKVEVPSWLQ